MNVLRDIPFAFFLCKNYYDDVIITGKNRHEHLNYVQLVLERESECIDVTGMHYYQIYKITYYT